MVPSTIFDLVEFPKNTSGKIDRVAIGKEVGKLLEAKRIADAISTSCLDLSEFEAQVLNSILGLRPGLDATEILNASNLILAGLDSLNLVSLTMIMERNFGAIFNADSAAAMGVSNFRQIISFLKTGKLEATLFEDLSPALLGRANRASDFVHSIPDLLCGYEERLILVLGSSGTLRGIRTDAAELEAKKYGELFKVINAGLPAINVKGLSRIAQHVAQSCKDLNVTLGGVLYELDPMLVCTKPPKGDIMLPEYIFQGGFVPVEAADLMAEFCWERSMQGDVDFPSDTVEKYSRAKWESLRDFEIDSAYRGHLQFDDERVNDWLKGAHHLIPVTDNFATFIHPLQGNEKQETPDGPLYRELISSIKSELSHKLIDSHSFDLPENLFMNINHMEPVFGSTKFTTQLMEQFLKSL